MINLPTASPQFYYNFIGLLLAALSNQRQGSVSRADLQGTGIKLRGGNGMGKLFCDPFPTAIALRYMQFALAPLPAIPSYETKLHFVDFLFYKHGARSVTEVL